jgi:hypothetical protein
MSVQDLTLLIKEHILKPLNKELRPQLNTAVQKLEINKEVTLKNLKDNFKGIGDKTARLILADIFRSLRANPDFVKTQGSMSWTVARTHSLRNPKVPLQSRYGVVQRWKTKLSKDLNTKWGKRVKGIGKVGSKFHLGHGSTSSGDKALAAVGYRGLKSVSSLEEAGQGSDSLSAGSEHLISLIQTEHPLLEKIDVRVHADRVFDTKSSVKKEYDIYLELQWGGQNLKDSPAEKAANKKIDEFFRNALKDEALMYKWAVASGSSVSYIKWVDNALDKVILGKKVKKDVGSTKSNSFVKSKAKRRKKASAPYTPPRIRDTKGRFTSAASIQQLLQAQITEQVKDNMGEGGSLVNRTGRFAESVTITNVTQTRQGSLTAFYNYMKYPYQTFERGFKQGSTRRDPRLLIHKSIREIAQKLVHRKLNIKSRRV